LTLTLKKVVPLRGLFVDLVRIITVLPSIEIQRRARSLHQAVRAVRRQAAGTPRRSEQDRARLRRAIAIVDRLMPGKPSCIRRALLEIRLDAGAAQERLLAGFKAQGGSRSGHAWLESQGTSERFDAVITV